MLYKGINIEERKPIWLALSDFYLDTELQESDFVSITSLIIESPYTLEEVERINKFEVFPVLHTNLLSVSGVWSGFDKEWLVQRIIDSLAKRNIIKKLVIRVQYRIFKRMYKEYWKKLKDTYNQKKKTKT